MSKHKCPDCGADPGAYHMDGCDVERCGVCRGQALGCSCPDEEFFTARKPWSGEWPGKAECRHFGLWARCETEWGEPVSRNSARVTRRAVRWHVPCRAGDAEASEDLNRWVGLGSPEIGETLPVALDIAVGRAIFGHVRWWCAGPVTEG